MNELNYPVDDLNSIAGTASQPHHELSLNKGNIVLLPNLQSENGHVHGSPYFPVSITDNVLLLRFAPGSN